MRLATAAGRPGQAMNRAVVDLALELFPYEAVYEPQRDFISRMVDALAGGKAGLFESPTGTGKTMSLLCAALAWQARASFESDEKENADLFVSELALPRKRRVKWAGKQGRAAAPADLDETVAGLLRSLQSEDEGAEGADGAEAAPRRRIYFCSRTHSQLEQVMGELRKILSKAEASGAADFSRYVAVTVGSRANLCVNKEVARLGTVGRINDRCLELQGADSKACCAQYNPDKGPSLELLADSIRRLRVADIEDMHALGSRIGACPYYTARRVQGEADFVTVPYNVLLQQATREAVGIDLRGAVVIVDEAHNLIDAINQMHSAVLPVDAVAGVHRALALYFDRYGKRMSPANAQMVQQLLHALAQLLAHAARQTASRMTRINDFLHDCGIDNLNVLPIQAYAQDARLSQKLAMFSTVDGEVAPGALSDALAFLVALSNADADGRVAIQVEGAAVRLKYVSLGAEAYFADVLEQAHSVILAGGTMSPAADYIDQLFGLGYPRDDIVQFRCGHLIPKESIVLLPVTHGPTGLPFDFTMAARGDDAMVQELGQAVINMVTAAPDGVVCFFPSFAYLEAVLAAWDRSDVLGTLRARKAVFVESQASWEGLMEGYREAVLRQGSRGALLFGVMGGRLSEGINFADRLGRLVIVVGLPFANAHDPETMERVGHFVARKQRATKDETTNFRSEFLENACMRLVNQTLGRVIRHRDDFAGMVLIDARYGQARIQRKLSAWMQPSLVAVPSFGLAYATLVKVLAGPGRIAHVCSFSGRTSTRSGLRCAIRWLQA